MKTPTFIKNAIYSAFVFFGTVILLSVGYATYNALTEVNTGDSLTKDIWNQMVGNIADINTRVATVDSSLNTLSTTVSALQVSAWNLWAANGGNISYTGGNVGIGTTTPGALVHVYKESGNNAEIDIQSVAGANKHWAMYNDRGSNSLRFWNNDAGMEKNILTLGSNGNVGIGTTSPSAKLDVTGEVKATNLTLTDTISQSTSIGALKLNGGGWAILIDDAGQKRISWNDGGGNFNIRAGNYVQSSSVGAIYTKWASDSNGGAASITLNTDNADGSISLATASIGTPGTPVTWNNSLTINWAGSSFWNYVGAGVASPHAWLDVNATFAIGGINTNKWGIWTDPSTDNFGIAYIGGNYPTFSGPTHLAITKTGEIGIGTSSPTQKLEVAGSVKATAFIGDGSGLTGVGGGVPAGAVFHFAMNTCPNGYLKANGAAVSRTTYSALFTAISTTFGAGDGSTTFNIPELRGEFIRSLDDLRGIDTGRVLGSAQAGSVESHSHTTDGTNGGNKTPVYYGADATFDALSNYASASDASYIVWSKTGTYGGTETRSRNVALLACIKY